MRLASTVARQRSSPHPCDRDVLRGPGARVGHAGVDPAERLHRRGDERIRLGLVPEVRLQGDSADLSTVSPEGDGRRDRTGERSGGRRRHYARTPTTSTRRPSLEVYAEYQRRLRAAGALDFDDMIIETVRLFQLPSGGPGALPGTVPLHPDRRVPGHEPRAVRAGEPAGREVSQHLRRRRRGPGRLLVAGATIKNILDFEHDYPDAAVFLMEQNYRSTQNILGIANALIEHNVQRKPKSLWTEAGNGELAVLYRAEDEHDEAFFVADEIERLRPGAKASVRRRRRLLPDERAEPCDRGRAHARRAALPDLRWRPVLSAQGDQGRPGVPAAAAEPAGRHLVPSCGQHAEARDRRCDGLGGRVVRARGRHQRDRRRPSRGRDPHPRGASEGRGGRLRRRSWTRCRLTWPTARARRAWWSSRRRSPGTWRSSRKTARWRRRAASRTCRRWRASPLSSWRGSPTPDLGRIPGAGLARRRAGRV